MLIAVDVEIAGHQRGIRLHVIGEFDDLELQPVLFDPGSDVLGKSGLFLVPEPGFFN